MGHEELSQIPKSNVIEVLKPHTILQEFDNIPSGNSLIHQLEQFIRPNLSSSAEQLHELSIVRQQKEMFENSPYIIFNFADFGLGDAIIQLSFAQALAREFDQQDNQGKYRKKILVLVPPAIKAIKSFTLPENLEMYETIDDVFADLHDINSNNSMIIQMLRGPVETILDFERKPFVEQTPTYLIPRSKKDARKPELKVDLVLEILKKNHRWVLPIDTRIESKNTLPYIDLIASLVTKHNLQNYSDLDLNFLVMLKLLGANIEVRNLNKPLFDKKSLDKLGKKYLEGPPWNKTGYQLVVALDAGESTNLDVDQNYMRSRKSPDADSIEETIRSLKQIYPNLKIAFVPGIKHKEYSQDVYNRIKKYYPSIDFIPTQTFDDMIGLFASSKVILTADSVTRWIAEAVIRTELTYESQASAIRMVTLHNGVLIPYELYGPRVSPVICLGYMPDYPRQVYDLVDIQIPGNTITQQLKKALQSHEINN